jgi:hypothetical protein
MKTIYNTYIVLQSQKQCNSLIKLVKNNKLPCDIRLSLFSFDNDRPVVFSFSRPFNQFFSYYKSGLKYDYITKTEVTEQEFRKLLKAKLQQE